MTDFFRPSQLLLTVAAVCADEVKPETKEVEKVVAEESTKYGDSYPSNYGANLGAIYKQSEGPGDYKNEERGPYGNDYRDGQRGIYGNNYDERYSQRRGPYGYRDGQRGGQYDYRDGQRGGPYGYNYDNRDGQRGLYDNDYKDGQRGGPYRNNYDDKDGQRDGPYPNNYGYRDGQRGYGDYDYNLYPEDYAQLYGLDGYKGKNDYRASELSYKLVPTGRFGLGFQRRFKYALGFRMPLTPRALAPLEYRQYEYYPRNLE